MKTTVVNIHHAGYYDVNIGRPGLFGNPFPIWKFKSRKDCIVAFKKYFYDRIKHDRKFKKEVLALKGKVLGCWCKPKACHGDVIIEYLEGEE